MRLNGILSFVTMVLLVGIADMNAQVMGNQMLQRQQSAIPRTPPPQQEPKALTAEEIVAQEMPKIIEALSLNDFEQAVVSTILTKYVDQRIQLQLLQLTPEKMREGLEKIQKNQRAELKSGLPEDKFLAFEEFQKNGFKVKKKKKKKKRSKTED